MHISYYCQIRKLEKKQEILTKMFENSFDMYSEECYYYLTKGATDRRLARFMN
ncbi:hypothetical protein KQI83_16500 [Roseburia sp. MSJ-14]|nr:hypothetical protein [Roseburia sp. MSJ-14]